MDYEVVLRFWFEELEPADWFRKSDALDTVIRDRFGAVYEAARRGELYEWRRSIRGRLAEIIVLDQFPRNMFRGTARAFESDALALLLAQEALDEREKLSVREKGFLYMPFMHSESLVIHDVAQGLFSEPGLEKRAKYEAQHRQQLERFGRYPHRNQALGRVSTPEEVEFLSASKDF